MRQAAKLVDEPGDPGTVDRFARLAQVEEKHELVAAGAAPRAADTATARTLTIRGVIFEPISVGHFIRAPAVGCRITRRKVVVFYVPDALDIRDRDQAWAEATLYVGDGASLRRAIQRRQNGRLVGHARQAQRMYAGSSDIYT